MESIAKGTLETCRHTSSDSVPVLLVAQELLELLTLAFVLLGELRILTIGLVGAIFFEVGSFLLEGGSFFLLIDAFLRRGQPRFRFGIVEPQIALRRFEVQ